MYATKTVFIFHYQNFAYYWQIILSMLRHWFYHKYFYWWNYGWLLFVGKLINNGFYFVVHSVGSKITNEFTDNKSTPNKKKTYRYNSVGNTIDDYGISSIEKIVYNCIDDLFSYYWWTESVSDLPIINSILCNFF